MSETARVRVETTFNKLRRNFDEKAQDMFKRIDRQGLLAFAMYIEARQLRATFDELVGEDDALESAKLRGGLRELEMLLSDVVSEIERRAEEEVSEDG